MYVDVTLVSSFWPGSTRNYHRYSLLAQKKKICVVCYFVFETYFVLVMYYFVVVTYLVFVTYFVFMTRMLLHKHKYTLRTVYMYCMDIR